MIRLIASLAALFSGLALFVAPAAAQQRPATPLFASDEVIDIAIRGDISAAQRMDEGVPATLELRGAAPETLAIQLSPRGVTRRRRDICAFPPLRIELTQEAPESSLFDGQRRIKLVTHCRPTDSHQQFLLLEYAAYRLYNAISPLSFRVRLARIDYYDGDAERPAVSRLGFLIEDVDDAARRNGLVEVETGDFPASRLSSADAARFAVFQYMIGNLDWAMEAGPDGEECCHNSKPIAASATATSGLIPMPYDFDHAGMVDAPYATPPAQLNMGNVRQRRYRGFCTYNEEARAVAADLLARRAELEAVFASIPELADRTRTRAIGYLDGFFQNVATPEAVDRNLMRACLR